MSTTEPMAVDSPTTRDFYDPEQHKKMDEKILASLTDLLDGQWHEDPLPPELQLALQLVIDGDPRLDRKWLEAMHNVPAEVWTAVGEALKARSFQRVRILCCIQAPETEEPMAVDGPPTRDFYQPEQHKKMDEKVLASLTDHLDGQWPEDPLPGELHLAFRLVIDGDTRLDRKWLEVIHKVPAEVWTAVEEALKARSFQRVRILCCIQARETPPPSKDYAQVASLAAAMAHGYKGNSIKAFIHYLERNDAFYRAERMKYYGRFCSVTQSSGTGKTRLLFELGKKNVCVLYINIRAPNDGGYPPRDDIPADILTAHLTEEQYALQCRVFFATVFKCIGAFLRNGHSSKLLSDIHSEMRTTFFQDIQKAFPEVKREMRTLPDDVTQTYIEAMVNAPCFSQAGYVPQVVIAIDESHVLHEKLKELSYLRATVLLRAINAFSEYDKAPWVVFASTVSKVADFAAPQALFPSARVAVQGEMLFPPFTQLGWDQHTPVLKDVELDKVAWGSHLLRYGRPLWWSLKNGQRVASIVELAKQKLCGISTFNPADKRHAFAVLGQRFGLDVAFGHREAIKYNDELIANHLRICEKTTEDRIWSYTTYPSEPVVSAAAAELLHAKKDNLGSALHVVRSCVNDGLINPGDSGELASRFIWLLAKDHCVEKGHVSPSLIPHPQVNNIVQKDYELPFCQLVPVVEFLKAVFGSGITAKAPSVEKTFRDAYINFSHWIQMDFDIIRGPGKINDVTIAEWTESLWVRTGAVQCCHNQPAIDKVIPMFFRSRPRGESMSHILISDKARGRSQRDTLEEITRQKITPADYSGPPYVVIVADLGLQNPQDDERLIVLDDSGEESRDQCLRIYAAALEDATYGFLTLDIARELRDLYARQDAPPGFEEEFEDQVRFGKSRERRYLNWKE